MSLPSYQKVLTPKLKKEGNETVTNCHTLKMLAADGKMRMTDVADTEQLFRLIQSIPSPKAEPFKLWLAKVAAERLDEMKDPELSIDRALKQYIKLGYTESWIKLRLKSIEIRKELTDEWKNRGLKEGKQFATLTDNITKAWKGKTTKANTLPFKTYQFIYQCKPIKRPLVKYRGRPWWFYGTPHSCHHRS
jgi:hypothetical protein